MRESNLYHVKSILYLLLTVTLAVGLSACNDSPLNSSQDSQANELRSTESASATSTNVTSDTGFPMQLLGTLGGDRSRAMDINDHGQVVGWSHNSSGDRRAFLWEPGKGMIDLGTLGGNDESEAHGINNKGQVVGFSRGNSGFSAFLWEPDEGMIDLGGLLGRGINENSRIVGSLVSKSNQEHAALWEPGADPIDLGTLDLGSTNRSRALDINDQGQVVGYSRAKSTLTFRAFLWDPDEGMINLGTLGGDRSRAFAINNNGQVVGRDRTASGEIRAFLWERGTGMTNLGSIVGGNTLSEARDISDSGQIVGYRAGDHIPPGFRAYLLEDGSGVTDLGALEVDRGSPYSRAFGINNNGQVVGETRTEFGQPNVAAVWTVTPEDTTPPELSFTVEKTNLWPPNHKMHLVVSGVSATDNVDPNPELNISVSSNESSNGKGDGNTESDWEVQQNGDGSYDVYVRAERSGNGEGRVYTITLDAADESGNTVEETVEVTVSHNKGKGAQ